MPNSGQQDPNPPCVSVLNATERDILWALLAGPKNGLEIKRFLNADHAAEYTENRIYENAGKLHDKSYIEIEQGKTANTYSLKPKGAEALRKRQNFIWRCCGQAQAESQ